MRTGSIAKRARGYDYTGRGAGRVHYKEAGLGRGPSERTDDRIGALPFLVAIVH
jgi:hypothetical protein